MLSAAQAGQAVLTAWTERIAPTGVQADKHARLVANQHITRALQMAMMLGRIRYVFFGWLYHATYEPQSWSAPDGSNALTASRAW